MRNQAVAEGVTLACDDRGGDTGVGGARRRPRSPGDRDAVRPQERYADTLAISGDTRGIMNRSTDRFEAAALTACSFDRVAFAAGEENPNRRGRCPAICLP